MTPAISDDAVEAPKQAPPLPNGLAPTRLSSVHQGLWGVFASLPGPPVDWSRATCGALFALIGTWAALFYATWAKWGNLSIDSGHEMYVPAMLAAGKMLYRDVWFMYGPAAPYFNSYLFRLFGTHLNVLYWAGSLAALGSAIFLYLTGMTLGSWVIGWTAGATVLIEAFEPGLFCFPLPYSSSAVYGCLCACVFLWLIIRATRSDRWFWMFSAGTVAGVALLVKLEFGVACYGTSLLLMVADSLGQRSWKPIYKGAAALLPGLLVCWLVARWMISIAGASFITQENFMSWPTSYFMKAYGKLWLAHTGFELSWEALGGAFGRVSKFAVFIAGVYAVLRRRHGAAILLAVGLAIATLNSLPSLSVFKGIVLFRTEVLLTVLRWVSICLTVGIGYYLFLVRKRSIASLFAVLLGLGASISISFSPFLVLQTASYFREIFFPVDMVLIMTAGAAACWVAYAKSLSRETLAIGILFVFPVVLAFRILMGMQPAGYPVYYNGPVFLSFLFFETFLLAPAVRRPGNFAQRLELAVCGCFLLTVLNHAQIFDLLSARLEPLTTERGVVWTDKQLADSYRAAIAFMKEKAARGDSVLSIPEDTSLYFLSGTICPTRVYQFTPGVLAPGKMTEETINEIEQKRVRYLLWSNRTFFEYGVTVFGVYFDEELAGYLKSHYRLVGPLIKNDHHGWEAMVWERMPEPGS